MMGESERLDTLKTLEENRKTVNTQMEKMPISLGTMSLRNKKKELEIRLAEIDSAI